MIGTGAIELAKQIALSQSATHLQLTTLHTNLNKIYENLGAHTVGELEGESLFGYPVTRMEFNL